MMSELRLTPAGHLRWNDEPRDSEPDAVSAAVRDAFARGDGEGLFVLAARKIEAPDRPAVRYWRGVAERYLTELCHIPGSTRDIRISEPSPADYGTWCLSAPPMEGGEYLTEAVLRRLWHRLDAWVREAVERAGGLDHFLETSAPHWHQVGRVCFHLAENKSDRQRPFAFLATYSTGFGTGGRLKYLPLQRALEHYAGSNNRPALLKLLSPVHQASESLPWVKEMVESGAIFRPSAWPVDKAHQFLKDVPSLEAAGLMVRLPDWWKKRPRPTVTVRIGEDAGRLLGADALLDFNVAVSLDGESLSPKEVEELLAGEDGLLFFKGRWIEVDRAKLQEALSHWEALRGRARDGKISFIEGMRLLAGAPANLDPDDDSESERQWSHVAPGQAIHALLAGLRNPANLEAVRAGKQLKATLRPYQEEGLAWLHLLTRLQLGACLADDMGLGKTLQVLALLLCLKQNHHPTPRAPSLLVVPASLLGNWRQEAARFTPSLQLTFLHPAETDRPALERIQRNPRDTLKKTDLAVTTYAMLHRQPWLAELDWHLVVLDEAQAIKNPATRQSKAARKLKSQARIAMTGTPIENHLSDLWSLFDFLNPGLLGSARRFKEFVKSLQNRPADHYAPLRNLVGPYLLRRLKTDPAIVKDLPEKSETTCYCGLTKRQIILYKKSVQWLRTTLSEAKDMARRGAVLQSLMQLKQICNHPSQHTGDADYSPAESGKFQRLAELCEEIASRQEKALVFTQFREITAPLAEFLEGVFHRPGLVLHGATQVRHRRALVEQFQDENGPPFFILSLKAGGTGLNLTAASHIIHFDRWWNPAVENQATDRAYRLGQKKNVLVHKLVTTGTVEERIDALINSKKNLARQILSSEKEINLTELTDEEILRLISLDVERAEWQT